MEGTNDGWIISAVILSQIFQQTCLKTTISRSMCSMWSEAVLLFRVALRCATVKSCYCHVSKFSIHCLLGIGQYRRQSSTCTCVFFYVWTVVLHWLVEKCLVIPGKHEVSIYCFKNIQNVDFCIHVAISEV